MNENSLPPNYSTILTNPAGRETNVQDCTQMRVETLEQIVRPRKHSAPDIPSQPSVSSHSPRNSFAFIRPYTASDVTAILSASSRKKNRPVCSQSVENLVMNEAPLGESSAILLQHQPLEEIESGTTIIPHTQHQ